MKASLLIASALSLGAGPAAYGPVYSGMPPARMQGPSAAIVFYVNNTNIACGNSDPTKYVFACVRVQDGVKITVLPNPCSLGQTEMFARLACHEAAHYSYDWTGNHEL